LDWRAINLPTALAMARLLVLTFVLLPWLNPFSPGPTAAVVPFLFSWVCLSLSLLVFAIGGLRRDVMFRAATTAWLTAAYISALIGLLQYFGATSWAGLWIDHTAFGEAYANLRQRNQFATLMNIGLAILIWRSTQPSSDKPRAEIGARTAQYLTLVAAISLGFGNAASSSRTGLMQLCLLVAMTWVWGRPTTFGSRDAARRLAPWHIVAAAVASYIIASLMLPWLAGLDPMSSGAWARLRSGDALCASRTTLWGNVLHLIAQRPVTGWGWGELDYAHFITLYPGPRFCDILDNAHNLPLHIAVELGIPAALAACAGLLWLIWRGQPQRESDPSRQIAWAVLAVIGLHSLLEYPLWYGPFQTATLFSLWQLSSRSSQAQGRAAGTNANRTVRGSLGSGALAIIAACGFAAWQYQLVSQIYLPQESRMAAYQEDTLKKISSVSLFQDQVRFADLTTMDLDAQNAQTVHDLAIDMLHFSPESRVVELVLDSAALLGRQEEIAFYSVRYQAAFPDSYAKWSAAKVKR
jgi:O-antigen ligase